MRIAFFGFSSPLAYDYKHSAEKAPADTMSSPNPIVFGATASMLLFDEIWFATRSLCPWSMRGLEFVKFLDEEGTLTSEMMKRSLEEISDLQGMFPHSLDMDFSQRKEYQRVQQEFLSANDFGWDNHTHALNVLGCRVLGNSGSQYHLELDRKLISLLRDSAVEQIHNPFWADNLSAEVKSLSEIGLTNELILNRIPNAFDMKGPRVENIERWRDNNYIGDYRAWLGSQEISSDPNKVKDTVAQIEKDILEAMTKSYLRELDRNRLYKSAAKNVVGEVIGHVVPGFSLVLENIKAAREEAKAAPERWRAFLLSLEQKS